MWASGTNAALRIVLEDALEPARGLVLLALLEREEAVDVEREVVLLEPRIVAEDAAEEIARHAVVELRRGAPLVDGLLVPRLEAVDELFALVFPLELPEAHERLGHLAGLARRLGDELLEEIDRLRAQLSFLDDVGLDARLELPLHPLAQRVRHLGPADRRLGGAVGAGGRTGAALCGDRVRGEGPLCRGCDGRARAQWRGRGRRRRRSRALRGRGRRGAGVGASPARGQSGRGGERDEGATACEKMLSHGGYFTSLPTYSSGQSSPSNGQYSSLSSRYCAASSESTASCGR